MSFAKTRAMFHAFAQEYKFPEKLPDFRDFKARLLNIVVEEVSKTAWPQVQTELRRLETKVGMLTGENTRLLVQQQEVVARDDIYRKMLEDLQSKVVDSALGDVEERLRVVNRGLLDANNNLQYRIAKLEKRLARKAARR